MDKSDEIKEVELFSSDNDFTISQVCAILEDNNIEYIKTEEAVYGYMKISTGVSYGNKRISVSNQDYEKALMLIKDIQENSDKDIAVEEIPEELKNVDESYFEELAKKGKISSYTNEEGKKFKYITRSEFKKRLKQENNKLIKDKKILNMAYILVIPIILLEIWKLYYRNINDFEVQWIRWIIEIFAIIPIIFVNFLINKKISKMRKKQISGEEYNNTEKPINKIVLICVLIISVLLLAYCLDWNHTVVTGNKPLFSVLDKEGSNEYGKKYKSIAYKYIVINNGRKFLGPKNKLIPNPYLYRSEDGTEIELIRTELIKGKLYIGIPNFLKNLTKETENNIYNDIKVLCNYGIKNDTAAFVFISQKTDIKINNNEIEKALEEDIKTYNKMYNNKIAILKKYTKKIDGKNIGVLEYNVEWENGVKANYFQFIYESKGELIKSEFMIATEQGFPSSVYGEMILSSLEIYD